MRTFKRFIFTITLTAVSATIWGQTRFDDSGISAGFFDSSEEKDINFSEFKLPPLAVLFENAKQNPAIMSLAKAEEIAQAEVVKQKKHIFSYIYGHASYSYGKTDMWGNGSSTYAPMVYQFQGSEQNYWNIGVNLSVPLADVLDLGHSVKRKRLQVESAQIQKDIAYDNLKLEIAKLYVRINNNLVALKTAGENAAIYQGAGKLNQEEFHHGNMEIEDFAWTTLREQQAVSTYQSLQTSITIDIITLEIMTHTPIITNTTTEITIDSTVQKSSKQIARENKAVERRIKEAVENEERQTEALEKEQRQKQKEEEKQKAKQQKAAAKVEK